MSARMGRVPARVLVSDVSSSAKVLCALMWSFLPEESTVSIKDLAAAMKASRGTTSRLLSELEEAGFIQVEPQYTELGGRAENRYSLIAEPMSQK